MLRSFAVDPMHQGNTIGTRLVQKILDEALDSGSDAVYLCTAKAPNLFAKIGFVGIDLDDVPEEIRNSELFARNCPHVSAFMKKRIF
ncbi:MAG: GNAT family N-acetyltransferase [Candidatus Thorarchaeota archaeon]